MKRFSLYRSICVSLGAILVSACSDSVLRTPTAPVEVTAQDTTNASRGGDGSGTTSGNQTLRALWWKTKQSADPVSQTIGPAGGTIAMPTSGLTVVFPAGAVSAPLTITITPDDRYVAYKMEPSGTVFRAPVTVTQLLEFTEVGGAPLREQLFAAYIPDSVQLSGNVPVLELEPSTTTLSPFTGLPEAQVWVIRHFSRYMLASG